MSMYVTIKRALLALCLVAACVVPSGAVVRTIGGANVDGSTPPPPLPVCNGVLDLTDAGELIAPDLPALSGNTYVLGVAPLINSFDGIMYWTVGVPVVPPINQILYVIDLPTFLITETLVTDTASNPDTPNNFGSYYNTYEQQFVNMSRQTAPVGTCPSADCFHTRTYQFDTPVANVTLGTNFTNGTVASTYDSAFTYVDNNPTFGAEIMKLDNSWNVVNSVKINGVANDHCQRPMDNDNTYVYCALNISGTGGTPVVKRITKSDLTITSHTVTGAVNNGALGVAVDIPLNRLYVSGITSGTQGALFVLDLAALTVTNTILLGAGNVPGRIHVDPYSDRIYVPFSTGAQGGWKRINRTTLSVEQTLIAAYSAGSAQPASTQIDLYHQKAYMPFSGGGATAQRVNRVSLCT